MKVKCYYLTVFKSFNLFLHFYILHKWGTTWHEKGGLVKVVKCAVGDVNGKVKRIWES